MFNSPVNYVYFLLILFIFTTTNVFSICYYPEKTCTNIYGSNWCCSSDETCGSDYGSCESSSNLPPAVIAVIIVGSIFCFIVCLSCCIQAQRKQHQQSLHTAYLNSNNRVVPNSYQQQVNRGPVRVVRVRPVYNTGTAPVSQPYPSLYEAPPPSYEVATANLPSVHQSSPPPPVTANIEQSNGLSS